MLQNMIPNYDIPPVPSQYFLSRPQLGHVLPYDLSPYHILVHLLQAGVKLGLDLCQIQKVFSNLQGLFLSQNPNIPDFSLVGHLDTLIQGG